jgi:predicted amidohydrolase
MLKGAEIILTPNSCTLEEMRLDQFKIRAWENLVNVAMTNYPAPKNNGHSVAYDCAGRCRAEAGEAEGLFLAKFDLDALRRRRSTGISGNAFRRPHRYGILAAPVEGEVWRRKDGDGDVWQRARR